MPPGGIHESRRHAVTPLNPEMIQVGDAVGQRAQWRGLLEGSVWPVSIVKVLVLPQHHLIR
jgi:hypothetical protein